MANNITGNPWYLDTVGTIWKYRWKFDGGVWNDAAAVGDTLVLTDITGRIVFSAKCTQINYPTLIPRMNWINGLVLLTLTSGNVTLYNPPR